MTKFVAHTSATRVREIAALDIIWGMGDTPEAAVAEAVENGGEDHATAADFDTHPASPALVEYLDVKLGDPQKFRILDGVADVIYDADDYDGLARALIEAAWAASNELDAPPNVLYVQLSKSDGWRARFSDTQDSETDMTRWNTGSEVTTLYAAIKSETYSAAAAEAGDIEGGWEAEWTEE